MTARKRNIGFRCAIGVCDLVLARIPDPSPQPDTPDETPASEEVRA